MAINTMWFPLEHSCEDALLLEKGDLINKDFVTLTWSSEDVTAAARLIKGFGGVKSGFFTQAGLIYYAQNKGLWFQDRDHFSFNE